MKNVIYESINKISYMNARDANLVGKSKSNSGGLCLFQQLQDMLEVTALSSNKCQSPFTRVLSHLPDQSGLLRDYES